ncbi:hypothetical protein L226DRAFT_538090 [Lentinus tigrinus ALCF2SS1-7]|uniref:DUF7598 domain-containing protein n=1 Tax=Lentinus tigrinus ALCF2SS1-6 TaxID=1328759 RepID=A0A5C2RZ80_9APHY|nr:hypothetical protein L227DRAFT_578805 [Lentinus tigrinus ALCF2SS1-6]RPD71523.1 hypothetical protein L226DRAFT_538090 [Lentinus tigrinus ALCF2SS1-7]
MLPPRAYIFLGLNAVRALSIISMLLVFASSIFVLVNDVEAVNRAAASSVDMTDCDYIDGSTVPNQPAGVFWAVVNRLLIIFQVIVLILSEVGWPARFFQTYFPVLGPDFGLGALGIFQCLIGATILSHHVDDFTLVAAFFLFALGCVNMLLGLFRERVKHRRSIMSWREEAKGVLPTHKDLRPPFARPSSTFMGRVFNRGENNASPGAGLRGNGFGRQGEKAAGLKGFIITRPVESLPRYAQSPASDSSRAGTPEPRFKSSTTAL